MFDKNLKCCLEWEESSWSIACLHQHQSGARQSDILCNDYGIHRMGRGALLTSHVAFRHDNISKSHTARLPYDPYPALNPEQVCDTTPSKMQQGSPKTEVLTN